MGQVPIAALIAEWVLAGKPAVVLLPLMVVAFGIALGTALLRDRAAARGRRQDDEVRPPRTDPPRREPGPDARARPRDKHR